MISFNELSGKTPKEMIDTVQKAVDEAERIVEEFRQKKAQLQAQDRVDESLVLEENQGYVLYRDKAENFSCDIDIAGAKPGNTDVRIVVESEEWNLVFPGKIVGGKCIIPLKKFSLFEDGFKGKIKLEVIAEDTLFVPWEENFTVKTSKKVAVSLHEREIVENLPEEKAKVRIQNIR
jgi:hypothetical protein